LVNIVRSRALPVGLKVLNLLDHIGTLLLKKPPVGIIINKGDVVAGHHVIVEQLGTGGDCEGASVCCTEPLTHWFKLY